MTWVQYLKRTTGKRISSHSFQNAGRNFSSQSLSYNGIGASSLSQLISGLELWVTKEQNIGPNLKNIINADKDRTTLGGEIVLSTMHASDEHPSSFHLMHFSGKQDKHFHPGPRLLHIFGHEPWFLYAGGIVDNIDGKERFNLVKIAFPGNSYTQLRFKPNFIHGFEGNDFSAISVHYTDLEELKGKSLPSEDSQSPTIMEKLTTVIPSEKIHMVTDEPVHYMLIQQLLNVNTPKKGMTR